MKNSDCRFSLPGLLALALATLSSAATAGEARFVAQFLPAQLATATAYEVVLQFKNTSRQTWSSAGGYQLLPLKNTQHWSVASVDLPAGENVAPGAVATFKFNITAPAQAGNYDFQWQLTRHRQTLAGERSPLVSLAVKPAQAKQQAEFVMQSLPGLVNEGPKFSILKLGEIFKAKVMFKNTGVTTWVPGEVVLVSQSPARNLTWMLDTVETPAKNAVAPGEFITFDFSASAPEKPGIYDFQWRLATRQQGEFGAQSELVKITVK